MKIYAVVLIAVVAFLAIPAEASKWEGQVVTKTKVTTKRVSHKTKVKTKKVAHRTKRGTQHIYSKTAVKTRPVRRATWHTGRKVVSRTKKIFN